MEEKKKSLFKKPKTRKQLAKRKITNLDDDDDHGDEEHESSTTIVIGQDHLSQQSTDNHNHPLQTVNNNDNDGMNPLAIPPSKEEKQTSSSPSSRSILEKIEFIKKSRKIKDQVRTRGLGAAGVAPSTALASLKKIKTIGMRSDATLPRSQAKEVNEKSDVESAEAIANQDLKQRLEGNFAVKGCNTNEEDGNVLLQKHKLAMEEFIQGQIKVKDKTYGDERIGNPEMEKGDSSFLQVKNTNDLYTKILQDAKQQLQDKNTAVDGSGNGRNNSLMVEDSDIGAGGAMLGGTGIAEVALPVEERIKAARETELAAAARMERRRMKKRHGDNDGHDNNGDYVDDLESQGMDNLHARYESMLPMSFVAGPGKQRRENRNVNVTGMQQQQQLLQQQPNMLALESDSVRRDPVLGRVLNKNSMPGIGSSYSHNFRLHNDEWIRKQKQQEQQQQQQLQQEEEEKRSIFLEEQSEVDDSNRIGFQARKRLKDHHPRSSQGASGGDGGGGKKKVERAHDDLVYKKFVSRELQNIRR
jgi:hypothetical protein